MLKKELSKVKNPNRVFRFSCRIWFPHRWVVKRHQYGEVEVVPTVVTDTPIPSSSSAQRLTGPDEVRPHFQLDDHFFTPFNDSFFFFLLIQLYVQTSFNDFLWVLFIFRTRGAGRLLSNSIRGGKLKPRMTLPVTKVARLATVWQLANHGNFLIDFLHHKLSIMKVETGNEYRSCM